MKHAIMYVWGDAVLTAYTSVVLTLTDAGPQKEPLFTRFHAHDQESEALHW